MIKSFFVIWCDAKKAEALAVKRGCKEGDSLLDFVEESEAEAGREFATLDDAKGWALKNKRLDVWFAPAVLAYEWPCPRRLSSERETVTHLRLDGSEWEDLT
jgi:hypothetical protein